VVRLAIFPFFSHSVHRRGRFLLRSLSTGQQLAFAFHPPLPWFRNEVALFFSIDLSLFFFFIAQLIHPVVCPVPVLCTGRRPFCFSPVFAAPYLYIRASFSMVKNFNLKSSFFPWDEAFRKSTGRNLPPSQFFLTFPSFCHIPPRPISSCPVCRCPKRSSLPVLFPIVRSDI